MKISTSNNLIGSAIWSKWAQVNISKATKFHKKLKNTSAYLHQTAWEIMLLLVNTFM